MASNSDNYCGKIYHKYLYLVGVTAVLVMLGSYWYIEYYGKKQPNIPTVSQQAGVDSRLSPPNGFAGNPNLAQSPAQAMPPQPHAQMVAAQPAPAAERNPFSAVVRSMMPSVVNVSATSAKNPQPELQGPPAQTQPGLKFAQPFSGIAQESIGSGVIVTAEGYILTNFHVIEQAQHITVTVFNELGTKRYHAEVVGRDEMRDLALLKITPKRPLQPAALGNSERMQVGDSVIAIGSPFGLDQTVSKGIVSGKGKVVNIGGTIHKGLLQTDAAINRGNSGGPLVDQSGNVIGINTAIYTTTSAFSGVGFAVPVDMAKEFLEELIRLPEVTPNLNTQPVAGTPVVAGQGGAPPIAADAVIVHDDRGPCETCHEILPPTQPVKFGMGPGGHNGRQAARQFAFTPGGAIGIPAANPAAQLGWVGAELLPLDQASAERLQSPVPGGVLVGSVQVGSPFEQAGMQADDIIFKIDGRRISSIDNMDKLLKGFEPGENVRVSIVRSGKRQDLTLLIAAPGVQTIAFQQPQQTFAGPNNGQNMAPQTFAQQNNNRNGAPQTFAGVNPGQPPQTKPTPKAGIAPAMTEFEWMGLEMSPIKKKVTANNPNPQGGASGALVAEIDVGTAAQRAGVKAQDIIKSINGHKIDSAAALDKAIKEATGQAGVLLEIDRKGQRLFTVLQ